MTQVQKSKNDLLYIPAHQVGKGQWRTRCEECYHTHSPHNQKTKDLSVNSTTGEYFCHRCNDKGCLDTHKTDQMDPTEYREPVKPPKMGNITQLSDGLVEWFRGRGISQKTLLECKIGENTRFVGGAGKSKTVEFNCWLSLSDDTPRRIKYRTRDKKFGTDKGFGDCPFGLWTAPGKKKGIIVEGEMDALSLMEVGLHDDYCILSSDGVSITEAEKAMWEENGTFPPNMAVNLKWLDYAWDSVKHIEQWVICTDMDAPGRKLQHELLRRLGAENCRIATMPEGYKDANDLLQKNRLELEMMVAAAPAAPIEGVYTIDDEWQGVVDLLTKSPEFGLSTGCPELDQHFRIQLGYLTFVNGHPGHGKSTFIFWLLVVCAVKYGWKFAIYSPETPGKPHPFATLMEIYLGMSRRTYKPSMMQLERGRAFIRDHFFVIDGQDGMTQTQILDKFQALVKSNGIHGGLIDPLNDLLPSVRPGLMRDQVLQMDLNEMRYFKKKNSFWLIVNAHPDKASQGGFEEHFEQGKRPMVPTEASFSGGAMYNNKADQIFAVYRNKYHETMYMFTEIHIQKIKEEPYNGKPTPKHAPVVLKFNAKINRYEGMSGHDPLGAAIAA